MSFEETATCFSDALSHVKVGAIIVGLHLRIRGTNTVADRILAGEDGIKARVGRLAIDSSDCQQELQRRINALWLEPTPFCLEPVRVARPSGLPSYALEVIPTRASGTAATVLISDPVGSCALPDASAIMQRFGLTGSEARVARLAPLGLTKAQIAQRLGLSENTVKYHLASARAKIGARNMVELALVMQRA